MARGWSQEQLAVRVGTTRATIDGIEKGRTKRSYRLREVLRILEIETEPSPLTTASDEELIKELRRRSGGQTAEVLRGYLEAKRADEATDPDTSQSGNDAAGDNAAS